MHPQGRPRPAWGGDEPQGPTLPRSWTTPRRALPRSPQCRAGCHHGHVHHACPVRGTDQGNTQPNQLSAAGAAARARPAPRPSRRPPAPGAARHTPRLFLDWGFAPPSSRHTEPGERRGHGGPRPRSGQSVSVLSPCRPRRGPLPGRSRRKADTCVRDHAALSPSPAGPRGCRPADASAPHAVDIAWPSLRDDGARRRQSSGDCGRAV